MNYYRIKGIPLLLDIIFKFGTLCILVTSNRKLLIFKRTGFLNACLITH